MVNNVEVASNLICKATQDIKSSSFLLYTMGMALLVSAILWPFMYIIIGRKFDKIIKQKSNNRVFLADFFNLPGIPIANQLLRTAIYSSLILHNYISVYKKMELLRSQKQKLNYWYKFWYKGYDYWYHMFQGYDFHANANRIEKIFVLLCAIVVGIALISILCDSLIESFNQFYCGILPSPP